MKPACIAFLAVICSISALIAQGQSQPSKSSGNSNNAPASQSATLQTQPPTSFGVACMEGPSRQGCPVPNACPVSMHAGHLAVGSMVKTDGAHPRGIGQWLSLSLTSLNQKPVESATLEVRGLMPEGHITEAAAGGGGEALQTFHVSFVAGPGQSSVASLWVPGMSAVERIDLLSVSYGDGSIWKLADGQSCRVAPDPFMLITGR